ncbi:MAG: hypothetical protein R6V47_01245 [Candidatus Delongbacteria bacterium]
MKNLRNTAATLILLSFFIFTACHTETPTSSSGSDASVKITVISGPAGTVYDYTDTNPVEIILEEGTYDVGIEITDGSDLYTLAVRAEALTGDDYRVGSYLSDPSNGPNTIQISYKDFPVISDNDPQEFNLYAELKDFSENIYLSNSLEVKAKNAYPFLLMHDELGKIREIGGDSVDFTEKIGELAFVQFLSNGCGSCFEEADEMKNMYKDDTYDQAYFSHSVFGRGYDSESDFKAEMEYRAYPFNSFWDGSDNVRSFFEALTENDDLSTSFIAVLPSGIIEKYDYEQGDFPVWIREIYDSVYARDVKKRGHEE